MVSLEDELRIEKVSSKYDSKIKKAALGVTLAATLGVLSAPLYVSNTYLNPYRNNLAIVKYKTINDALKILKSDELKKAKPYLEDILYRGGQIRSIDKSIETAEVDLKQLKETEVVKSYNAWDDRGNKMFAAFGVIVGPLFFISWFKKKKYEERKEKEIESLGIVVTEPLTVENK